MQRMAPERPRVTLEDRLLVRLGIVAATMRATPVD